MPLYDPGAHEELTSSTWSEERARTAIEWIVEEAADSHQPGRYWSAPDDELDLSLWTGAAGVLWALDQLGAGLGEAGLSEALGELDRPGLMTGAAGVLLVSRRLAPSPETDARLAAVVEGNERNPSHELFDGAPGTMLAAIHAYEATGEERWADLWRASADALLDQLRVDPERGCKVWIQYRRGRMIRSVGAGHGLASNFRSLLRGEALLGAERTAEVQQAAAETAQVLALREDGLANWPTAVDRLWAEEFPIRVQWCHGAPGLVTSLSALPRDELSDALLTAAGELVWRAGPLVKGPGLCHGTAGNGCAFLALHARTGEERWLERARAFAVHAIEQVERGKPSFSLWTGDVGVALYLRACLEGWRGMPVIDYL